MRGRAPLLSRLITAIVIEPTAPTVQTPKRRNRW
jgi:hypothetical protein